MILQNEQFSVEIKKIGSPLNEELFDFVYDFENYKNEDLFTVLEIKCSNFGKQIVIAIFCDFCGDYECCTVLNKNKLVIAKFNTVYEIDLERGDVKYKIFTDLAGAVGLYKVEDGYIIHGEMEIVKLDFELNEVWWFSGADIFATINGEKAFSITKDKIQLVDFQNNHYTINLTGELIEDFMKNQERYNSFKEITENPIILDFAKCGNNLGKVHLMLKEKFGLPEYYGANWDALWDCLRYLFDDEIVVEIHNFYSMETKLCKYCQPMLRIFDDINKETPNFTYKIIS